MRGWILFLLAFAAGIINVWLHTPNQRPDFFTDHLQIRDDILVQITDPVQTKVTYAATTAKIIAIQHENGLQKATGKLTLYVENDGVRKLPEYGDQVLIKNKISALTSSNNPGEFDYRKYMSYKGIYHSAYLKKGEWVLTGINEGNHFWSAIYQINSRINYEITKALPDPDQSGIAEALILGNESDIPGEIMTEYAGTGTVHILSVSGLHVGIILIGLSWIFSFLTRIRYGKLIRMILILSIIWCYAFLTGFSAPIARSVIMFSIIFIGLNIGRRTNIYNSLCASAIVLMLIDPYIVMAASCQLSFIALTGIIWLQPMISKWWEPENKILKYIWELAAASLAAQIITLPVSIFYFNQFSIYFLPANLIVIPASFVVLIVGIAFVFGAMTPFLWIHNILSVMLKTSIDIMNHIVRFINELPGATWQGLYLNTLGMLLLYLFIILAIFGIIYRNKKIVAIAFVFGICFFATRDASIYKSYTNSELGMIYVSPDHAVIMLKDRNKLYVISDSGFTQNTKLMKYRMNGYAFKNYISPANIVSLNSEKKSNFSDANMMEHMPVIGFYDKAMLMVNSDNALNVRAGFTPALASNFDAVVLYNKPKIVLSDLYKKARFKSVIAASGDMRGWETECIENHIPFFNLQKNNYVNIPI